MERKGIIQHAVALEGIICFGGPMDGRMVGVDPRDSIFVGMTNHVEGKTYQHDYRLRVIVCGCGAKSRVMVYHGSHDATDPYDGRRWILKGDPTPKPPTGLDWLRAQTRPGVFIFAGQVYFLSVDPDRSMNVTPARATCAYAYVATNGKGMNMDQCFPDGCDDLSDATVNWLWRDEEVAS